MHYFIELVIYKRKNLLFRLASLTLKWTCYTHFLWFWFGTAIERLDTTGRTVKSEDVQKTVTHTLSLPFIFCILLKRSVSVPPPLFPPPCVPPQSLYSQPLYLHKINTARTLKKMLLTVCSSDYSTWQSNIGTMPSFSSSLAVNPARVVMLKKVNKSMRNKSKRKRFTIIFCLVLTFCDILGKKNHLNGAISNKVLTV